MAIPSEATNYAALCDALLRLLAADLHGAEEEIESLRRDLDMLDADLPPLERERAATELRHRQARCARMLRVLKEMSQLITQARERAATYAQP